MRVCFSFVVLVNPGFNKDVRCSLGVFHRDILGVIDREAELVIGDGLRLDVPRLLLGSSFAVLFEDVDPT